MSLRKACLESSKAAAQATHALVKFFVDSTVSVVKVSRVRVDAGELKAGNECSVKWSKGKQYAGVLLAVGSEEEVVDAMVQTLEKEHEEKTPKKKEKKPKKKDAKKKKKKQDSAFEIKCLGSPTREATSKEASATNEGAGTATKEAASATSKGAGTATKETTSTATSKEAGIATKPRCNEQGKHEDTKEAASADATGPAESSRTVVRAHKRKRRTSVSSQSSLSSLSLSSDSDDSVIISPAIEKVITVREVKSPVHMTNSYMYQELTDDIKEIKSTLYELKDAFTVFTQHNRQSYPQPYQYGPPLYNPFSIQPPPHFQPPSTPPCQPEIPDEHTPPPLPPSIVEPNEFSASFLLELKSESCSRANFASKLVGKQFTKEERKTSNVKRVLGKKQLDPNKMAQIKQAVFQMYPCESGETQSRAWAACRIAVDESCRRLNRPKKDI